MAQDSSNDPSLRYAPPAASRTMSVALTPEEKLSGDMLMLTTGFMMCAAALWLAVYWSMGYQYSTAIPLIFQGLSVLTIALWWKFRRLYTFAVIQLGLILFTPFAMQWSIGNFVNASGVSLWGLMAPVGAVTVLGTRQSMPWFFAWLQVDASHEEVRLEKERSEKLLLNILPPAIAERLKRNEINIAQGHADVTVMFADIVGFTRMTEELSPVETVKILNDIFSIFDELADKHRVEKIKTIGDAYMAAAGLDTGANIHYADAIASMAIEMIQKLEEYRRRTGERLQIRIGIATGPVVAGVIGKKKFIYDMWGDTVNVAFRLAADAPAETIKVDLMTHRRLHSRFQFDAAQELEIKGKGRMQVFELRGPIARASAVA